MHLYNDIVTLYNYVQSNSLPLNSLILHWVSKLGIYSSSTVNGTLRAGKSNYDVKRYNEKVYYRIANG